MKQRIYVFAGLLLLVAATLFVGRTIAQRNDDTDASTASERWEYLVVSGSSNVNLNPSGNSSMRKEPSAGFGREAFVLEQHLDKLGAKGWELVSVQEGRGDPTYFFKRRK